MLADFADDGGEEAFANYQYIPHWSVMLTGTVLDNRKHDGHVVCDVKRLHALNASRQQKKSGKHHIFRYIGLGKNTPP